MSRSEKKPPAAHPDTIAHYRIVKKLGEGGMGEVYAAQDERLGRIVAIKKIRQGAGDPRARERLWREARSAASINHPNVCQIYEIGDEAGEPFIVMELLEGESLAERLAAGPLSLTDAAPVMLGMLTALQALHRNGLVHRDLKPSNIFLTPHGIKLLDFGLARLSRVAAGLDGQHEKGETEVEVTLPGTVVGTPRYMAPEQLQGESGDQKADLFAVGAILVEMLTWKPAFAGETPMQIFHAVMYEQPASLSGSTAIDAMNRIIQRALAKRCEDRYESAEAMAQDLRLALLHPDTDAKVRARPMRRLIVLPFRMLRPDPEIDYLSFSLAEAISVSLSGLETLLVRSNITASRFTGDVPDLKRIADEADVDSVLTGTLLRAGEQIRVTTQLVEAPAGTILWSHSAQIPLRDLFQIEEMVTRRIVESLSLDPSEHGARQIRRDVPANPTAYEFYLRGSQQGHGPTHWMVGRDLLLQAVEADPHYAPAWARLARCYWLLGKYGGDAEGYTDQAEAALQRALEINPELPMAHHVYAQIEVSDGRALNAMQRLLGRARAGSSDPTLYTGLVLAFRFCGLLDASIAAHEQARRLDPKVPTSVLHTYWMMGDCERALLEVRDNIGFMDIILLLMIGRREEAVVRVRARADDGPPDTMYGRWRALSRAMVEGNRADCLRLLEELVPCFRDPEGLFYGARTFAYLSEPDRALDVLRRSVEGGFFCFPILSQDAWLDGLRTRPEFAEILRLAESRHLEARSAFVEGDGERVLGVTPRA